MSLKIHWATYVKKYHTFSYHTVNSGEEDDGAECGNQNNGIDNDDDCIVSLPGKPELDTMDVEKSNNLDDAIDDIIKNGLNNKRQRVWPV